MVRNCADLGTNLRKIVTRLTANQNLLKLMYYTDQDPLNKEKHEDLSQEIIQKEIFDKLLKITPRISPEETQNAKSLVALRITSGSATENGEFRNINIAIESFVPLTQWFIKDENLRPFMIMGEIENSLKGKTINGLGKIRGGDFELKFLTEEISCYEQSFVITTYD